MNGISSRQKDVTKNIKMDYGNVYWTYLPSKCFMKVKMVLFWMATRSNGLYQFDNDICVNHIVNNPGTANSLCSNDSKGGNRRPVR